MFNVSEVVMPAQTDSPESNSTSRIRVQYLIEKELADRLRAAGKDERRRSYTELYDELYRRIPDHPQLVRKVDLEWRRMVVAERLTLLQPYLGPNIAYLEIGPGDCALAIAVAPRVRKVYAIDVSEEMGVGLKLPENLERVISDGSSVPVAPNSIDVAYSDQLMEHLHPDDAPEQLRNIYNALAPGGTYLCITPNSFSGPHDVSRDFDDVATGLHLKEYSAGELSELFRRTGFRKLKVLAGARGRHIACPPGLISALESMLSSLPGRLGKRLGRLLPFRVILGIKLLATK